MRGDGPVFGLGSGATVSTIAPRDLAQFMEANGFESLWYGEHSHVPTGQKSLRPQYRETPREYQDLFDPLIALTSAAEATTTLKLGTSVLLLPEHHPIRLAKMLATLDHLSNGRLVVGVGAGWSAEEMADYGVAFEDRWKVVRETVLAMREIWTHEIAEFSGAFVNFPPMWSGPRPARPGGPAILMGAWNRFALPRIADYCDGWVPVDQGEKMGVLMADLRDEMARSGRSFDDLDHSIVMDPLSHFSIPDNVGQRIAELHAMGFRRILFTFLQDSAEAQWKTLEKLVRVIKPFQ